MDERRPYLERLHGQLRDWDAARERLGARAVKLPAQAKAEFEVESAKLRAKRDEAVARLTELEQKGETAWDELKQSVDAK
jgi:hypothetical protein